MGIKELAKGLIRVERGLTVSEAAKIMNDNNIGCVIVHSDGENIGIMTERDLLTKVIAKGFDHQKMKVEEIMSSPIISVDINSTQEEVSDLMSKHKVRRVAIEDNNTIVGMVTARDLAEKFKYSMRDKMTRHKDFEHYKPEYL